MHSKYYEAKKVLLSLDQPETQKNSWEYELSPRKQRRPRQTKLDSWVDSYCPHPRKDSSFKFNFDTVADSNLLTGGSFRGTKFQHNSCLPKLTIRRNQKKAQMKAAYSGVAKQIILGLQEPSTSRRKRSQSCKQTYSILDYRWDLEKLEQRSRQRLSNYLLHKTIGLGMADT